MEQTHATRTRWGHLGLSGWLRNGLGLGFRHYPLFVLIGLPIEALLAVAAHYSGDLSNASARFALTLPLVALVTPVAKAAAIVATARVVEGRRVQVWEAYAPVLRRLPVVLVAAALWIALVAGGVVLLVVPGLILLIAGQCLMGAVVIEGRGPIAGFQRSWQLVRPVVWSVAALFVLLEVGAGIATAVVEAGFGALAGEGLLTQVVARAATAPLVYVPLAVLFLDRRAAVVGDEHDVGGRSPGQPGL